MATVRYNHPASSGDLIPRIDVPESGSRQEPTKVAKSRLPAKMPALSRTHSFPGSRRTHSSVDLTAERSELGSGLFYGPNRYVGSEVGLHGQDHKDLHMPIIIHEDMSDLIDHRFDTSNEPTNTDTSTVLAAIRGQGLPPTKDLPKSIPEPSEITDHGHQRYNELKNEKLVPWFPVDDNELEGNLSDRILEASCENSQDRQEFLPKSQLDRLIHPSSVRLELRRWLPRLTEDKIRSYANRICHGRAETIDKSTTEDLVKSYQKVFAVLVLVNKVDTIELFLGENVCDADLPLQRYTRKKDAERRKVELRRKKQPGRRLDCFRLWDQAAIRNFEKYQWAVVPPFFTKGKRKNVQHYVLEPSTVLPFIFTENASSGRRGGYSRVFEADIHPDHHNFNGPQRNEQDTSEPSQNTFAIKRLQDLTSKEAFQKEVQILKRFSGDTHPHLISLLATFERSGVFYLIFPWAGADLKTYWKSKNPRPTHDADTVIWMAEQCSGLAEGLTKLHQYETGLNDKTESPKKDFLAPNVVLNGGKDSGRPGPLYGRHGDIKPENILWFPDSKVSCHKGTLKISDFGLSELNSRYSKSQRRSQLPNSPSYRPPECDLRKKIIKQSYDIWTLGCLYLEFITWTLGGWDLVQTFASRRQPVDPGETESNCFFEIREDGRDARVDAFVKPAVTKFVSELRSHPRCSEFLSSFLDMIMGEMLIVESESNRRLGCMQVMHQIKTWHRKCLVDADFALSSSRRV